MLAGVGGGGAPLVLHLLARARYRAVDWGGMMFLEARDSRQAAAARLEEGGLFLARMGVVGLVGGGGWVGLWGGARAGLFLGGKGAGGEGRVTAVIVLDRSYSMGFE